MERGLTLIELLITLTVLSLILTLAVPGYTDLMARQRAQSVQTQIQQFLSAGRQAAINLNRNTTVCPSRDGVQCAGEWAQTWILFDDPNLDRAVGPNEQILQRWQPPPGISFVARPVTLTAINWAPTGFTRGTPGSLIWCVDHQIRALHQVSITLQGRIRALQDLDGDGIRDVSQIPAPCNR